MRRVKLAIEPVVQKGRMGLVSSRRRREENLLRVGPRRGPGLGPYFLARRPSAPTSQCFPMKFFENGQEPPLSEMRAVSYLGLPVRYPEYR